MSAIVSLDQVTESRLCWPPTKPRDPQRVGSPFRNREAATESRAIEREMEKWRVRQFIVSRNNQRIFAGDPGAALWWLDRKKELRVLACDKYQKLADNLHAIALTLGAMRALERWGAYTAEQAAEGARLALPGPETAPADPPWWIVLQADRAWPLPAIEGMYRVAVKGADEARLRALNLAIEAARKEKA